MREKEQEKKTSVAVLAQPILETKKIAAAKENDTAFVEAELSGFKFACHIDSGADRDAISETVDNFLGDNGVFIPT